MRGLAQPLSDDLMRRETVWRSPAPGHSRTECVEKRKLRERAHRPRQADPIESKYFLGFSTFFLQASCLPFRFSGGDWATGRFL